MPELDLTLHWIDYVIVAVYFAGVMAHGIWVARTNRDTSDAYFLAGRALPWYLIGFSLYASNMSGASFVGLRRFDSAPLGSTTPLSNAIEQRRTTAIRPRLRVSPLRG